MHYKKRFCCINVNFKVFDGIIWQSDNLAEVEKEQSLNKAKTKYRKFLRPKVPEFIMSDIDILFSLQGIF